MAETPEVNISFNASTSLVSRVTRRPRIAVEKAYVHALDVAENLTAHVEHDFLSGPLHQVGLDELEQVTENQRGQIDARDLRDPTTAFGLSQRVTAAGCGAGRAVM